MATFNTRIQNRIDTWATWIDVNPTPLAGEICIATVPAETGAVKQEPAVLIKIGDGERDFKNLPILTAKAGNVSDWALADSKPAYEAGEIGGIDAYIAAYVNDQMGISVDTDTQYRLVKVDDYNYKLQSKEKADTAWTDVIGSAFVIPEYDDTALTNRIAAVEGDLTDLKGTGDGSIAKLISDAIAALDLANTYAAKTHDHEIGEVNGLTEALAGKQAAGDYATRGEAQGYANAKDAAIEAAQSAANKAQEDIDALELVVGTPAEDKTVVEMIQGAQTALDAVAGRVAATEGALTTLTANADTIGSVDYKIAQAVASIVENPDETMNSINELVIWCSDHATDALALNNQVSANKEDIADLATLIGNLPEGSVSTDVVGYIGEAIAALSIGDYAKATELGAAVERIVAIEGKMTTIEGKVATIEGDYLKTADKEELSGDIAEVDGKFASYSTTEQVNAAIKVEADRASGVEDALSGRLDALEAIDHTTYAKDADLAAVAKSGNIAALTQTAGEHIIFACGNAAGWDEQT